MLLDQISSLSAWAAEGKGEDRIRRSFMGCSFGGDRVAQLTGCHNDTEDVGISVSTVEVLRVRILSFSVRRSKRASSRTSVVRSFRFSGSTTLRSSVEYHVGLMSGYYPDIRRGGSRYCRINTFRVAG